MELFIAFFLMFILFALSEIRSKIMDMNSLKKREIEILSNHSVKIQNFLECIEPSAHAALKAVSLGKDNKDVNDLTRRLLLKELEGNQK